MRSHVVGGQAIRVDIRHGRPAGGVPLVLCNGIGASLEVLDPVVAALPPEIEVVRFDVPGVGGSAPARRPYLMFELASLVRRMLDDLGYDAVDVLGLSWGGGLAQQLALARDGRCRRLVLVSTSPGVVMVPARPRVLLHMMTPRRYLDRAYARRIAGTIYGGAMRDHPEEAAAIISSRHNRLTSASGYAFQLLALATWTSIPLGRRIRQPTLVLSGRDDPLIPLINARILSRLIPDARLHVFDDGHVALISRAAELVPVIVDFLNGPC